MDDEVKMILESIGLDINQLQLSGQIILSRDTLIDPQKYKDLSPSVQELKKYLSSSNLTSLHSNAPDIQKWPLLNLVRQILTAYGYMMTPKRVAKGYTPEKKKKFQRYFVITSRKTIVTFANNI